jgi:hypothetical protein
VVEPVEVVPLEEVAPIVVPEIIQE